MDHKYIFNEPEVALEGPETTLAEFRAQQTTPKVKALIEELTRSYGVTTLQLFYRDASGKERLWFWDGQNAMIATPAVPVVSPTADPEI